VMAEPDPLTEAREALVVLEDLKRFLIVDVGQSGILTLANTGQWANQLTNVCNRIDAQKATIAKLKRLERENQPSISGRTKGDRNNGQIS